MLSVVCATLLSYPPQWSIPKTPYADARPLQIVSVDTIGEPIANKVVEFNINLAASFDNPFDPKQIAVDAKISLEGSTWNIPAFIYRAYSRKLESGQEVNAPAGETSWHVRFCPPKAGHYQLTLTATDKSGTKTQFHDFDAKASISPGFIGISKRNKRFFEFDDGSSYFPIGQNVCWGNGPGTFSYDDWFGQMGKVRANYARLWLGPYWSTFALETSGKAADGSGFGQFSLTNAWRLDQVVKTASANGLYLMLCIDSYNSLRMKDGYPAWEKAPINSDNGGPLRIPTDFWSDDTAATWYRNKLRYLVARYSAYQQVFAWEFWNEVDITQDFQIDQVKSWHQSMARYLSSIDPYKHLITTSFSNSMGYRPIDLLPEIDFVQSHHYNNPDLAGTVAYQQSRKADWGKPHFFGEIGADAASPRADDDPEGLQAHDPLWISFAVGSSGGAMTWWWDNLIAPKNLYSLFGNAAEFARGIDWPGEGFHQTDVSLAYADEKSPKSKADLDLSGGPVVWEPAPSNRPSTTRVSANGVSGDTPSGILHGVRNHPNLHNTATFAVDLPRATDFIIEVGEVSGYGGAKLVVTIDGDKVMTRDFITSENGEQGGSSSKYAGPYTVTIPAGQHTVVVDNIGNDWFYVSYRFAALLNTPTPPIEAWAVLGDRTAIAWVRLRGRTWKSIAALKRNIAPAPPTVIGLAGLASGTWKVEIWDTWSGKIIANREQRVTNSGKIRVELPSISKDIAVKLLKK